MVTPAPNSVSVLNAVLNKFGDSSSKSEVPDHSYVLPVDQVSALVVAKKSSPTQIVLS